MFPCMRGSVKKDAWRRNIFTPSAVPSPVLIRRTKQMPGNIQIKTFIAYFTHSCNSIKYTAYPPLNRKRHNCQDRRVGRYFAVDGADLTA